MLANQRQLCLYCVEHCRPLSSFVSEQESMICDIVWMLLQSHISLCQTPFFQQMMQWPCPVWKQFSSDHRCWGIWKPGYDFPCGTYQDF